MSVNKFVIWTRYERPDGKVIRHVYGTWPTRAKAQTVLNRMLDTGPVGHGEGKTETAIVKLLED